MFRNPFLTSKPSGISRFNFSGDQPDFNVMQDEQIQQPGLIDRYRQLVNKHPYLDRFAGEMENAPRREDYKPGKVSRLGAILAGASASFLQDPGRGSEVMNSLIDRPFNQASEDYKNRLGNLSSLADIERSGIGDQIRGLELENSINNQNRDFKLREKGADLDERQFGLSRDRFGLEKDRALEDMEENDWLTQQDENTGDTFRVNKKTGQKTLLGHYGRSAGDILNDRLRIEREQGNQARQTQAQANASREKIANERETRLRGVAGNKAEPLKAQLGSILLEANAKGWPVDDLVELDANGVYRVKPESSWFPDDEVTKTRKAALNAAFAKAASSVNVGPKDGQPGGLKLTPQEEKDGWKIVNGVKVRVG